MMMRAVASLRPAAAAAIASAPRLSFSTRLRSADQAAREGTATSPPLRSPYAPPDPADIPKTSTTRSGDSDSKEGAGAGATATTTATPSAPTAADPEAERHARDDAISHAGGGFGAAIIQQNLAAREGHPVDPSQRVDPTSTPPGMSVPTEPSKLGEQLPFAARRLKERFAEAGAYLLKGEEGVRGGGAGGRASNSATRHGAAVELAGDGEAVARETETQGMPPLGQADPVHQRLAADFKRREGI